MKRQSGFTIIEIMIVTVIIGILAVVAVRSITGYVVRAKVSEAVLALSACRTVVGEVFMSADSLPTAGDPWGCEASQSSKYVDTITVDAVPFPGVVKVGIRGVGDLRADFHTISLAPLDGSGARLTDVGRVARWRCGAAIDGTDISLELLPSTCRGN